MEKDVETLRQPGGWLRSSHPLRKRNSSLVKWLRADNVTGLKRGTEAADLRDLRILLVVGEHSQPE